MYKYVETEYRLNVKNGYTKRKCLDLDVFTFKERCLIDTYRDCSWKDHKEFTWETLPDKTQVSVKDTVYYKSRASFYELRLVNHGSEDPYIVPVRILRQIDCPNATFTFTESNKILFDTDYTLKEVFDKAPAYKVLEYLKEHGLNSEGIAYPKERGVENFSVEENNK